MATATALAGRRGLAKLGKGLRRGPHGLVVLSKGVLRRTPLNPLALAEVNSARALPVALGHGCYAARPRS